MKIMTILGTRPEIIRLSRVIPLLDSLCEHVVVHTGQNYDRALHDIFFEDLKLRKPDYQLECKSATLMEQVSKILVECEKVIQKEKPDRLLILGDTNSALSSIVAKRMAIPVFHMEAGNRCFDDRVPEEVNRRIVDHSSDILMPYTERSRANLLREGIPGHRIFVTGNPIREVLEYYSDQIENSSVLSKLSIQAKKYFLVTLHRAENVDLPDRLDQFISALKAVHQEYQLPIICSMHPRTRSKLEALSKNMEEGGLIPIEPPGLFDFVHLEKKAFCVLSDSGTVQEECCIYQIPNVTIRDVTERPETIEAGSNILSGASSTDIIRCLKTVFGNPAPWEPPKEYLQAMVSSTVSKIVLGFHR